MREAELRVLGDTQLLIDGEAVGLSRGKATLLCALALHDPQPLGINDLAALLWDEPPGGYRKAIQNQVRRIRGDLGDGLIETVGTGYRLGRSVEVTDISALERIDTAAPVDELEQRLAGWRGEPFRDLSATPEVWAARDRLTSLRSEGLSALGRQLVQRGETDRVQALLASPALPEHVRSQLLANGPNQRNDQPASQIVLSKSQRAAVDQLLDKIDHARASGNSQAIVIGGTAGAGKSTILSALADRIPIEMLVLRAGCQSAPAHAHEVLKTLILDLPDTSEVDTNLLVLDQLATAIEPLPYEIVILLDDVQWATFGLLAFIERLAHGSKPVTLVAATRDGDAARDILVNWPVVSVEAPALEVDAVEAMIQHIVDDDETDASELALDLHFLTSGAPLFTSRLVHELVAQNAVEIRDGVWTLRRHHDIPQSLNDAVMRQLSALSVKSRLVLELIATMHRVGGESTTREIADQLPPTIAEIEESGLATPHAGAWQMHAEVARSIYEQLPQGSQADLHLNAVALLADSAPIAAARHVVLSRDQHSAARLDLLVAAAEYATEEADWPVAVEMWDEVLIVAESTSAPAETILDWSISHTDAARMVGDPRQLELMRALMGQVEAVQDPARWAAAAIAICSFGATSDLGPSPEFVEFTDQALGLDLSDADRARLLAASTDLHGLGGDQQLLQRRFDEAYRLATRIDDATVLGDVLRAAYISVVHPDELDRRRDLGLQLLALSSGAKNLASESEAHHLLFSCALQRGDKQLLDHHAQADEALAPALRSAHVRWRREYMRATRLHLLGQLDDADASATRCVELGTALGAERAFSVYGALIVGIRYDQGRLQELRPIVETLRAESPDRGAWIAVSAFIEAQAGDRARASRHLRRLADSGFSLLTIDPTYSASLWVTGLACADVADRETAELLLPLLRPLAGRMAWTGVSSPGSMDLPLGRLLALVGEVDAAREVLGSAASHHERQGWPIIHMRLQLALSSLAIDTPEAQQLVRSVYARATQLDLGGIAAHARSLRGG